MSFTYLTDSCSKALRRRTTHVALLFLVGTLIFLPFLGQEKRFYNREIRHAEIAKEMARNGNVIVPTLFSERVGPLGRRVLLVE